MKTYSTTFLFLVLSVNIYSKSKCNCQALIDWQYNGQVYVYEKPNGQVIDSIANDSTNENFVIIKILDTQKDYFKVSMKLAFTNADKMGWIKKENYIGTYARNYSDGTILKLYSQPDKNSKIESIINEWIQNSILLTIKVLQMKGNSTIYHGRIVNYSPDFDIMFLD